jgi:hypothetical protein
MMITCTMYQGKRQIKVSYWSAYGNTKIQLSLALTLHDHFSQLFLLLLLDVLPLRVGTEIS